MIVNAALVWTTIPRDACPYEFRSRYGMASGAGSADEDDADLIQVGSRIYTRRLNGQNFAASF